MSNTFDEREEYIRKELERIDAEELSEEEAFKKIRQGNENLAEEFEKADNQLEAEKDAQLQRVDDTEKLVLEDIEDAEGEEAEKLHQTVEELDKQRDILVATMEAKMKHVQLMKLKMELLQAQLASGELRPDALDQIKELCEEEEDDEETKEAEPKTETKEDSDEEEDDEDGPTPEQMQELIDEHQRLKRLKMLLTALGGDDEEDDTRRSADGCVILDEDPEKITEINEETTITAGGNEEEESKGEKDTSAQLEEEEKTHEELIENILQQHKELEEMRNLLQVLQYQQARKNADDANEIEPTKPAVVEEEDNQEEEEEEGDIDINKIQQMLAFLSNSAATSPSAAATSETSSSTKQDDDKQQLQRGLAPAELEQVKNVEKKLQFMESEAAALNSENEHLKEKLQQLQQQASWNYVEDAVVKLRGEPARHFLQWDEYITLLGSKFKRRIFVLVDNLFSESEKPALLDTDKMGSILQLPEGSKDTLVGVYSLGVHALSAMNAAGNNWFIKCSDSTTVDVPVIADLMEIFITWGNGNYPSKDKDENSNNDANDGPKAASPTEKKDEANREEGTVATIGTEEKPSETATTSNATSATSSTPDQPKPKTSEPEESNATKSCIEYIFVGCDYKPYNPIYEKARKYGIENIKIFTEERVRGDSYGSYPLKQIPAGIFEEVDEEDEEP